MPKGVRLAKLAEREREKDWTSCLLKGGTLASTKELLTMRRGESLMGKNP
jgi:hypothetical protein